MSAFTVEDRDEYRHRVTESLERAYTAGGSSRVMPGWEGIDALALSLVPPLPTQPRRVQLREGVFAEYLGNEQFSVTTNRNAFGGVTPNSVEVNGISFGVVLSHHTPLGQHAAIAAKLLDLIATPTEPATPAPVPVVSDAPTWRDLSRNDWDGLFQLWCAPITIAPIAAAMNVAMRKLLAVQS